MLISTFLVLITLEIMLGENLIEFINSESNRVR